MSMFVWKTDLTSEACWKCTPNKPAVLNLISPLCSWLCSLVCMHVMKNTLGTQRLHGSTYHSVSSHSKECSKAKQLATDPGAVLPVHCMENGCCLFFCWLFKPAYHFRIIMLEKSTNPRYRLVSHICKVQMYFFSVGTSTCHVPRMYSWRIRALYHFSSFIYSRIQ